MATRAYDPIETLDGIAGRMPPELPFEATDAKAARAWQRKARRALAKRVGFLDLDDVKPQPKVEHEVDRGDYVRRKVVIRTTEHSAMPLYLLIPKDAPAPMPTVLAFHGHGYGVKDMIGLWEDGEERYTPGGYHKDFGCELAKRGFLVAAPEISCFGERRSPTEIDADAGTSSCHLAANYAFMLGGTVVGLRVLDAMRAVDYLDTLDEADTSRLGAMGISGGGLHTFFSTCLDPRIRAVVISGYFCDWRRSIVPIVHCACNFVPGVLQLGELHDLAGLIAPRPCLVENGSRDPIFPIEDVKRTVKRARRAWRAFEAADRLQSDYFEGRHEISGAKAYDFLAEHLGK